MHKSKPKQKNMSPQMHYFGGCFFILSLPIIIGLMGCTIFTLVMVARQEPVAGLPWYMYVGIALMLALLIFLTIRSIRRYLRYTSPQAQLDQTEKLKRKQKEKTSD